MCMLVCCVGKTYKVKIKKILQNWMEKSLRGKKQPANYKWGLSACFEATKLKKSNFRTMGRNSIQKQRKNQINEEIN